MKQLSIQSDIDIILDIRKYVVMSRRRIIDTIFAPEIEPTLPAIESNPPKPKNKLKSKSPTKKIPPAAERAYSVDGDVDLVEQAMRILQTSEETKASSKSSSRRRKNRELYDEPAHNSTNDDSPDSGYSSSDDEGDNTSNHRRGDSDSQSEDNSLSRRDEALLKRLKKEKKNKSKQTANRLSNV